MRACMHAHMCQGAYVEVRGELEGVGLNEEDRLGGKGISSLIHLVSTKDSLIVPLRGSFPELL